MNSFTETVVALAALAVIFGIGIYAAEHVTCWHIPYFANGCVISK